MITSQKFFGSYFSDVHPLLALYGEEALRMDWGSRGSGDGRGALRIGGPLAGEVATYSLPVAAVARVAPPAAGVAAFIQEYPAAALAGAEFDPAQLL